MHGRQTPQALPRSFWVLLILSVAMRCVALTDPLIDSNLLRQCQTAAATADLLGQGGLHLSTGIPWVADLSARYVLELPLYNYLVIAVHWFIGDLEVSGKLTSIALWAISFFLLQALWRRMLKPEQIFWANIIFAMAPLQLFCGQAFMPEMLVQTLAFSFILLAFRYGEEPTLRRWIAVSATGLLALLIKLPAAAHLYLILGGLILPRERWRALARPRYVAAGLITIIALKWWGEFRDAVDVNGAAFDRSAVMLRGFIGTIRDRMEPMGWAKIGIYIAVFVIPGPAFLAAVYGAWLLSKARGEYFILKLWLLSIAGFYLLWFGQGANVQGYYNLVVVPVFAALAGMGIVGLFQRKGFSFQGKRAFSVPFLALLLATIIPICMYLFRPDYQILAASRWAGEHTKPGEAFVFRAQHRHDMLDYPWNPVPAFYANRPTFIWVRNTPEAAKEAELKTARLVVITLPRPESGSVLSGLVRRFRSTAVPPPDNWDWLQEKGFRKATETVDFVVYEKI